MAKRPVLAAAAAGDAALLAGALLLTGTGTRHDTASRTVSTPGGGQSPARVEAVSWPYPAPVPREAGPGLLLEGPEKPDGSGAGALVVLAPHHFSFSRGQYPGGVKTKNLALSMDQAGILSLVGDRGPQWSTNLLWSTETRAPGGQAVFQTDGNLVIYAADGRPLWATGTDNVQPPSLGLS